ncbi:CheR family methyltransferase [Deinococcus yavapaiensis]|uniref:protein-glutamate O-methyltransferase n=1 Tax=Deinococcus yavapaiensis KR-236 TaxID=694435 RepID=A0A318S2W9_9DEIO|nr:CheR family methyltransferase [Deinococcus yavapaiensis]PYE50008.1 two-component system CheB/CheR fusion protein [Deinococcus yavapaiensis KR-236]
MTDDSNRPPNTAAPSSTEAALSPTPPTRIVALGGSAGALDGYERFFLGLPPGSGMTFVVVTHLSPNGESLMPDLLRRCTSLPVELIEDGLRVEPDHVYVIPAGFSLAVMNGTLLLRDLDVAEGRVIDAFLASLAADVGERAVAVILSGMGSDGTRGVRAIKENFGLVLAQDPTTADYPAMPTSAIATGVVDEVRPADELASHLLERVTRERLLQSDPAASSADLQRVLLLVRERTGQDFTRYKHATLLRRMDRRLKSHRLDSLAQYHQFLQQHPSEVDALFDDLTINVTSFFRDPEAFERLKAHLRMTLTRDERGGEAVRAWTVGCASGEEAYSVAMVLHELTQEPEWRGPTGIQVFATDIDPRSIDKARAGLYPASIEQTVTPERLRRYFTPTSGGYHVNSVLRDLIVFALHNTFNDPPFTRLDLLTCRNMLIYLNADLQQQILSVFHYALQPNGLLLLGVSETTGSHDERFQTLDSRWKIYLRELGAVNTLPVGLILVRSPSTRLSQAQPPERRAARTYHLPSPVERLLLAMYAPPAVVVNAEGDILYVTGRTSRFLELPSGSSGTVNVLDMTHDGMRFELASAMRRATREKRAVTLRDVRQDEDREVLVLDVTVHPVQSPEAQAQDTLLVVFQERPAEEAVPATPEQIDQVQALTREVQHLRETLRATMEENVISNEELRSTNEEYQTTIEELKSTNEELLTSKEELQSVNEELLTTNAEHQGVIHDLARANDDIKNLLESAGIATLYLGNDLRIKRFTTQITRVMNLIGSDVGRHVGDLNVKLRDVNLEQDVTAVLETLLPHEAQVRTLDDHWYLMRINPYRTADNFIDGVVVAFTNIDSVKEIEAKLDQSVLHSEALLNCIIIPMVEFDDDLRVITANKALYDLLRVSPEQARARPVYDLGSLGRQQLDSWELRAKLSEMVLTDVPLTNHVIDLDVPGVGVQKMKVEAWPVLSTDGQQAVHLMTLENITSILEEVVKDVTSGEAEENEGR